MRAARRSGTLAQLQGHRLGRVRPEARQQRVGTRSTVSDRSRRDSIPAQRATSLPHDLGSDTQNCRSRMLVSAQLHGSTLRLCPSTNIAAAPARTSSTSTCRARRRQRRHAQAAEVLRSTDSGRALAPSGGRVSSNGTAWVAGARRRPRKTSEQGALSELRGACARQWSDGRTRDRLRRRRIRKVASGRVRRNARVAGDTPRPPVSRRRLCRDSI